MHTPRPASTCSIRVGQDESADRLDLAGPGRRAGRRFRSALADNIIIAERSAKFGLPECLFNLFPGMGALSFLTRKVGASMAEKMVFSGQIYTAAELHEMGVVEVLAEDAMGEQAVYDFVEKTERSFASRRAVYASRQIINPIRREELDRIVDMWVDAALSLADRSSARWSGWLPRRIAAGPPSTRMRE